MSEKTQKPTEKRLRDARKKGEVTFSAETVSAFIFIAVIAALATQTPNAIGVLHELFAVMFQAVAAREGHVDHDQLGLAGRELGVAHLPSLIGQPGLQQGQCHRIGADGLDAARRRGDVG